jgi:hypothetical protein
VASLQLDDHPWELVAFGLLAGVWLASHGKRGDKASGLATALIGGLALRLVRLGAMHGMRKLVHTFVAEAPPAAPARRSPYAS